jgi:hypothetical protein
MYSYVFTKRRNKVYWFLRTKGVYVLYGLILMSFVADITGVYQLDLLGIVMSRAVGLLEIPITKFWGLMF